MSERENALRTIFSDPYYAVLDQILVEARDRAIDSIIKEKASGPSMLRAIEEVRTLFRAYHLNCGRR